MTTLSVYRSSVRGTACDARSISKQTAQSDANRDAIGEFSDPLHWD